MVWIINVLKFIYNYRAFFELLIKKPKFKKDTFEDTGVSVYNTLTSRIGIKAVEIDVSLVKAAQSHADWMGSTGRLTHVGAFGKTARQRAIMSGYKGMYIAEHVFICGTCDAQSAIELLLDSISAKEDLRENFRSFGVGRSGKYWCVLLGR